MVDEDCSRHRLFTRRTECMYFQNRNQTVECLVHEHCIYLELQAVELCQYFVVIKNFVRA